MSEPVRLLNGPADGLASMLLRAGIDEKPPGKSLERTLAALAAAGATLGVTSATLGAAGGGVASATAKGTAMLTLAGLAQWGGAGALTGVVIALVSHAATNERRVPPPPAVAPSAASAVPTPHLTRAAPLRAASASVPQRPLPAGAASLPVPARASASANDAPLAAEVAFVDRGRVAFQRRDGDGALTALDGYERAFPERRLLPEVLYLRMEARVMLGDTARATALARLILRDFASSPHAVRARAILGAP